MLNTGFPEINFERLNYKGKTPWFVEIAITGNCNFSCHYCNHFSSNIDFGVLKNWFQSVGKVKHIHVTGGEPTIHSNFSEIISFCRNYSEILSLSTNGSYDNYDIFSFIDQYSISLDDYDCDVLLSRGYKNPDKLIETIKHLSEKKYVNIGLLIDKLNFDRSEKIIDFILDLGVHDIKISISSHSPSLMPKFTKTYDNYPILSYRVKNFNDNYKMRGFPTKHCHIMENDVTIVGDKHYPCLVYFREGGKEIGKLNDETMLEDRINWSKNHNCQEDEICSKYCMDFKCHFNLEKEKII